MTGLCPLSVLNFSLTVLDLTAVLFLYLVYVYSHQMLPDRRGGRPKSSISLPTWGGDPLPTSGSGEGDVIMPAFGVYPVLLGRRCYVERVVLTEPSE